jgi:hypothetical protein
MSAIIVGIFLILHSLVHLLYAGQSGRFFELRPHMTWPDGSWAFSKLLGGESVRLLASILLALAGCSSGRDGGVRQQQDQLLYLPCSLSSCGMESFRHCMIKVGLLFLSTWRFWW